MRLCVSRWECWLWRRLPDRKLSFWRRAKEQSAACTFHQKDTQLRHCGTHQQTNKRTNATNKYKKANKQPKMFGLCIKTTKDSPEIVWHKQQTTIKMRKQRKEQKKKTINENAYKQTKCDVNIPAGGETAETQTQQRWQDCMGTAIVEKKNFFANFEILDLRCDYDLAVKNDQGGDVGFLRVMSLTLVECYPPLRWGGQVGPLSLTLCSAPKSLFSRSSHNPDGDCHNPRNQTISPSQSDLVTTLKSSQRQLQQVLCPCLRLELLLLPWMASSCRAGARSLKVSEAAATAARQPGGGRREGETYVTTKQNKALPKP